MILPKPYDKSKHSTAATLYNTRRTQTNQNSTLQCVHCKTASASNYYQTSNGISCNHCAFGGEFTGAKGTGDDQ